MAKPFLKRRRNDLVYGCARFLIFIARLLPRSMGLRLFGFFGICAYHLPLVERQRTRDNLNKIFSSHWSQRQIERASRSVYRNFAANIFDSLYLSACDDAACFRIVHHDDFGPLAEAYRQGRGVVVVTCHLGCFEMMVHTVARHGLRCFTIGQKLFDERIDTLVRRMRSSNTATYLHRDGSGRHVLRCLKEGQIFGVLIDQDTNLQGVFSTFLGIPAFTPSGPVRIALQHDIPLFVAYTTRQKDNTHYLSMQGPIAVVRSGDPQKDLVLTVEKINGMLSAAIMENPTQWVWMHRRWHTDYRDPRYSQVPSILHYQ
ncbi:MAG: lysophospholipid acyltransferase family protein [Chitinivibrionales bacterium]|nr:lysophospholipid acyltransferase family protein [Chitinivibrionales bacterium]